MFMKLNLRSSGVMDMKLPLYIYRSCCPFVVYLSMNWSSELYFIKTFRTFQLCPIYNTTKIVREYDQEKFVLSHFRSQEY